jgi:hypothetical protein
MTIAVKIALLGLWAVALVVVMLKLIVPLLFLYVGGMGVANPLPKRLAMAHPRLAIYMFVLGGPLLFAILVATGIWLLCLRIAPR